jgi:hypothetical protein
LKKDDLLGFLSGSGELCRKSFQSGSSDSMVFGRCPMGQWKIHIHNFCKEYWENNYKGKVVVYNFNPLRYMDRKNLFEKFVDGLIRVIQNISLS